MVSGSNLTQWRRTRSEMTDIKQNLFKVDFEYLLRCYGKQFFTLGTEEAKNVFVKHDCTKNFTFLKYFFLFYFNKG